MIRHLVPITLMLFVAAPALAEDSLKDAEYYPFKIGTTWEYKVGGNPIIVKVAKHEKYNEVLCARVETSVNGNVVAFEHVAPTADGLKRLSMAGMKADPAVLFMKLPYKKGESWHVESTIGPESLKLDYTYGEEEITVPAGKYKTISTTTSKFKAGNMEMQATIWYAKGVGMVKTILDLGGNKVDMQLEKFTAGK